MPSPVVVVGAGPGLGHSLAHRFGVEGRSVALIARNREKLEKVADGLRAEGIPVGVYPADVTDESGLTTAVLTAAAELGRIGVLCYCPAPDWPALYATGKALDFASLGFTTPTETTATSARRQFEITVAGALTATRAVLPGMRASKDGTLLFTAGRSGNVLAPMMANAGLATAGLRNWIANMHAVLAPEGVFVGRVAIGKAIVPGSGEGDPDSIAERCYQFAQARDTFEITIGFDD
jgi:short-subunit dehydrogenase